MTMTLYPALQDNSDNSQDSVAIKLYDKQQVAACNHAQGIFRLINLQLHSELKQLEKQLPNIDKACLLFTPYGSCANLKEDIITGILLTALRESLTGDEFGAGTIYLIRDQQTFNGLLAAVREKLQANKTEICQAVVNALRANQVLSKQLKANIPFNMVNTAADIKYQQSQLIDKGFIARTPLVWLKRLPRYFKGMGTRLEKARSDYRRDALNQAQIKPLWENYENKYHVLVSEQKMPGILCFVEPQLEEYRWLIEELRISLFAQELKTSQPVSVKRLEKKWQELS